MVTFDPIGFCSIKCRSWTVNHITKTKSISNWARMWYIYWSRYWLLMKLTTCHVKNHRFACYKYIFVVFFSTSLIRAKVLIKANWLIIGCRFVSDMHALYKSWPPTLSYYHATNDSNHGNDYTSLMAIVIAIFCVVFVYNIRRVLLHVHVLSLCSLVLFRMLFC